MEATNPNRSMIKKNQSYVSAVFIYSQTVKVQQKGLMKTKYKYKPQSIVYISLQNFSVVFTATVAHFIDQWSYLKMYYLDTRPES